MTYYARVRLIVNLLPLLQKAPALRRVVTVFGGTKEGALCTSDLSGRSLGGGTTTATHANKPSSSSAAGSSSSSYAPATTPSVQLQLRAHTSSMTTLALESLAFEAPDVSFVHSFPGLVRTNLARDVRVGASAMGLMKAVFKVVGPIVTVPVAEAGERQLFLATTGRFPARSNMYGAASGVDVVGVALGHGVKVARGSDARVGSGVYSVGFDGEAQAEKVEEAVQRLRDEDLVRRLWLHTVEEFVRVTGSEFV